MKVIEKLENKMKNKSLKEVLVLTKDISENEALMEIAIAREQFQHSLNTGNLTLAMEICNEYSGIKPDFLIELL